MMKFITLVFVFSLAFSDTSFAQETPHYDVVAEYIRELGETKNNQDIATLELAGEGNQMMAAIRSSTRVKLKLSASINVLKSMKLKKPFETLIPSVIYFYQQKIELHNELIKIATVFFVDSPKPNVDYTQLAAQTPKITASLEYIDETLFRLVTPLFFALLVDQKPDNQNHLSRLIITREQGKKLVDRINNMFGSSLDGKNQNWTVSSASLLKTYLLEKGFKFSDDPE